MGIGCSEILLSLALIVIFMGPKSIPELLRSLFKIKSDFNKFQQNLIREKNELLSLGENNVKNQKQKNSYNSNSSVSSERDVITPKERTKL